MMPAIPQSDPRAGYLAHRQEIDAAVAAVLAGGSYILGREVTAFEREFAAYLGVGHAIGVASGTDALHLALRACGIGSGDTVITVSHTAVATVAAIELAGAAPLLVDVDPTTLTMDPFRLSEAIHRSGARLRAVVPVHLYGHPADMSAILDIAGRHGLQVVEDCAQAHGGSFRGRKLGSWGAIAAFSFYPTKNLGALGDGGAVVTDDPALAERARALREYGWERRYVSEQAGMNSRLDEIQAAVLRVKLRHLDAGNAARRKLADCYETALAESALRLPFAAAGVCHAYHQYVVRSRARDGLKGHLERRGIATSIHYPVPVHLQPAYRNRVARTGSLAISEQLAGEVLSLPMYPELDLGQARTVAATIRQVS
ncbi:MAG TPA: DegT/DnrJ/EryC1/StrS family aminotransferase [Candidatus Methylomirabilis sp.]|nr:DegT/DnrJ/EryC1/StrS family aminotransferase [Candidatus Methylomirabilis sp.]